MDFALIDHVFDILIKMNNGINLDYASKIFSL